MKPFFEFMINDVKISIPAYTLFSCLGALIALLIIYERVSKIKDMSFKKYLGLISLMAFGMVLGSKLLFVLTILPDIICNWSIKYASDRIVTAGFVFYGGLSGVIVGIYAFSKLSNIQFVTISNAICPALPAFHAFGRIGCLFAGCCYGKVIEKGFYHLQSDSSVSRIPIQLYESVLLLCITVFIFLIGKTHKEAQLLYIYLLIYAIGRFVIEFFRGDLLRGIWFGLSTSQWIAMVYFVLSIINIYKWSLKKKSG